MASHEAAPVEGALFADVAATESKGCGKQCMGPCCLPGSRLPRYCYSRRPSCGGQARRNLSTSNLSNMSSTTSLTDSGESLGSDASSSEDDIMQRKSFLDSLIVSMWDERVEEGLFRYSVGACETRVIPGTRGFIAQYNEGRHSKKRPTEFRMDAVLQPFDAAKFNFTKVGQREALFTFEDDSLIPGLSPTEAEATPTASAFVEDASVPLSGNGRSANIVAINVSPIEYGHVLLIPRVLDQIPQRIDAASLLLALRFAAEVDNPCFRLGYNSLGAFATVNHLHFQGYYLERPFAIEMASTAPIWGPANDGTLTISEFQDYPVRGFAFDVGGNPKQAAELIASLCDSLQTANMPFNMFVSNCGARVFFYPQRYAERQAKGEVEADLLDTEVNAAVFEISGHMVMKRRGDFDEIDETLAERLLAAVSLPEEKFADVRSTCLGLAEKLVSCGEGSS